LPHEPQLFESKFTSMHAPLHDTVPVQHAAATKVTVGVCGSAAPPLVAVMVLVSAVVDAIVPVVTPAAFVGAG
jgi:hypothetical protein